MAESGLNIVAFKKISIRYVIVTVAVIGIVQALAWTILSLISILYYNNVIQITDDTYQQDYSYWIYKIYLQNGIKIIDFIIDPVSFNIFMYFYMVLSFVWLIISCYILWAMVRDKWDYTKCSLVSWASVTLAVAALDIILMSLIASDIDTAKGLFKPMSTPITTTTMFSSITPYTESSTIPTFETTTTTTIPETTTETTTITTITTTTDPSTTPIITTTTEPSTTTTEPSTTITEPSTTITEPSTTITEPSTTITVPSTTTTEPSTTTTITTTTEPSTTTTEPSTTITEPSTTITEPSTTTTEPSTTITESSTTITEPSTTTTEPSTTITEPSTTTTITTTTEPSTTTTEPSTTTTEPSTTITEPSTTITQLSTTITEPSTTITEPSPTITEPSTTPSTTLPSEFLAVGNNNVEMGNILLLELNEEWFTQFMIVYPNQVTTFNTAMSIVMSIAARGYVLWILNVVFALIFIFMVHQMKKQEKRSMLPIIDAYAMGQRPFTLYDTTDIGPGNWNNGFEPDQNIIFSPKGNPMSKNTPNIDDSTPQNFDMFQPYVTPGRNPTRYIASPTRPVSSPTRPVASTSGAVGRPARSDYYPKPLEIAQGGQRLAKIGKSTPGRRTPPQRVPSPQVPGMPYIPPPDYTPPGSPSTRPRSVLRPKSNYVL